MATQNKANRTKKANNTRSISAEKFGTYLGVYTPSVLTILGLIMYLRFGWVVGNLGLGLTFLIILISSTITFITGLSASAVATNMKVGVGGEYYLISHSLGLELGGAIGIPLFLCRTLSITFYCYGLSESILTLIPGGHEIIPYADQVLAGVFIVLITAVSGKSAGLALRLQIPIMVVVGLSLLALVIGVFSGDLRQPEWTATFRTAPEGFWYVFAVFFPAVTGFTAGIGMSGDLKDPGKSIPRGTLLAIATGTIIYMIVPVLFVITNRISFQELATPGVQSWVSVAFLGIWLIYPGMLGAILSSAFGSALGGPRVLQALAKDGIAPGILSKLSKTGQPVIATAFTGLIALSAVLLGGLNAVAQFVTVLFLTLYVTINLSASIEQLVSDPSYRPSIHVPWYVSLIGALGAVFIMLLINPLACLLAIGFELLLYVYLRRRALKTQWGDVRAGLWIALTRFALIKHHFYANDPRNWRPHILLFAGDVSKRIGLVRMASWFNQNRGIITVCNILEGDLLLKKPDVEPVLAEMEKALEGENLLAFNEVHVVPDFAKGVVSIAQAKGIAGLKANTIMFGWSEKPERQINQLRMMRALSNINKNTIIIRLNWAHEPGRSKRIDLWWRGKQRNGDLMLLLAYLLSLNAEWRDAKIFIRSVVENEKERKGMTASLNTIIRTVRMNVEREIISKPPDQTITQVIHTYSKNADVVFLGLNEVEPGNEKQYKDGLIELSSGLHTTVFVRNAGELAGRLI